MSLLMNFVQLDILVGDMRAEQEAWKPLSIPQPAATARMLHSRSGCRLALAARLQLHKHLRLPASGRSWSATVTIGTGVGGARDKWRQDGACSAALRCAFRCTRQRERRKRVLHPRSHQSTHSRIHPPQSTVPLHQRPKQNHRCLGSIASIFSSSKGKKRRNQKGRRQANRASSLLGLLSALLWFLLMGEPRRPRFFKVLIGANFARRIEIPQGFLCHITERHRNSETKVVASAKVVDANGHTWPVELEEIDGHVFLTSGWAKFVEGNCLVEGEFLVFKYDGNLQFMVSVFGVNAVEKAVLSSESDAQATENLEELPFGIVPSRKTGHNGDTLTDPVKTLTCGHPQTVTTQRSNQGDEYISSQGTVGFLDPHEVGLSKDNLETYCSKKEPMDDDKAKAKAEVMRSLHVDKLTVDLFCATLCLYKWKVEAAAEDFNICRGKPQIPEQSLKQKLVLQFDIVNRQLRHFFPPDDDSERIKENNLERPNLSNQSQPCNLTVAPVKRRLVDEHESCDLPHQQKRRILKLQQGSLKTQTPRRSPRLSHLNNICNDTNKVLKARAEVLKPPPATTNQVKATAYKSCSLHEKPDNALKAVREETTGSLSQNPMKLDPPQGTVDLSKVQEHDQVNDGDNSKEVESDAVGTSESLLSTDCVEPVPTNSGLSAYSRIDELSFTWKHSQHDKPLERILLDIQRDNFVNIIANIQKIIQDDPSDVLSADVIEATLRIGILKWDLCIQDRNAQKIVNALLDYAKKVKGKHNFNIEMRKEEFSSKLQDLWKWQLKELEITYASLESDFNKAATDANIFFSTWEEHKKKLHSIKDGIKDLQQMIKGDEMQKLEHQVAEHEAAFQKSIMDKVRAKMALKSYQQIMDDVKERLASTEPGSIDVGALVKVEMDNMRREIELSKGSLLNINFKKE
ncbi:hypothetical protein BS78_03G261000 [Paspalum vaginatum]|nr:hypothetical protein BS78_03G261000 [Paspalum vaginatum]